MFAWQWKAKDDMENNCFICGNPRHKFDHISPEVSLAHKHSGTSLVPSSPPQLFSQRWGKTERYCWLLGINLLSYSVGVWSSYQVWPPSMGLHLLLCLSGEDWHQWPQCYWEASLWYSKFQVGWDEKVYLGEVLKGEYLCCIIRKYYQLCDLPVPSSESWSALSTPVVKLW